MPISSIAQIERRAQESVRVYFRQGVAVIDEDYKDNGDNLRRFVEILNSFQKDSVCKFNPIRVVASVSPEGPVATNQRILKSRAEAIVGWLDNNTATPLDYTIDIINVDWDTLIESVEASDEVPYKQEVLNILHNTPEYVDGVRLRYNQLIRLRNGKPYKWILDNLFQHIRYADALLDVYWEIIPKLILTSDSNMNFSHEGSEGVVTYSKNVEDDTTPMVNTNAEWITSITTKDNTIVFEVANNSEQVARSAEIEVKCYNDTYKLVVSQDAAPTPIQAPVDEVEDEVEDVVESIEVEQIPQTRIPLYWALKTNMLYDVLATPNIGVEFYVGRNFSVAANWHFAWWNMKKREKNWCNYGGDIALRKWFGKRAMQTHLSGHHVGLYSQMMTYDVALGKTGYLANECNWTIGAEYGYSLPIARRFNIDFTIGAGYHWGKFHEYTYIDGHRSWQATKQRHYIGPTKCEVSLVWLIGSDNYNKDKEGKR